MRNYFKLIRIHHYMKNFLVFAALICSGQLFDAKKLTSGIVSFVSFCMVSSVVYIINDIQDREKDRRHPEKCKRPIASGTVSVKNGIILMFILAAIAVICCFVMQNIYVTLLMMLYLVLNIAYSFGLKNIPLVDVTILVSGFLIRILCGAFATGITISNWLYLTVIAAAFYFALGKRRNELKQVGEKNTRNVLKSYPINFLDKNMYMCLTLANVFYALWSMDETTVSLYNNRYLIFTVPVVILITMKYNLDIEGESNGDPVDVLLGDKFLICLCGIYFILMFCILYYPKLTAFL